MVVVKTKYIIQKSKTLTADADGKLTNQIRKTMPILFETKTYLNSTNRCHMQNPTPSCHVFVSPSKTRGIEPMNIDTPDTIHTNTSSERTPESVLRSSLLYTSKKNTNDRKRVSIVSPMNWDCKKTRRDFINTTISYCDIKNILRTMGYDVTGSYNKCVNQLIQSNWIPDQTYILYNEKLRAKPIFHENERIVNLECGNIEYLKKFSLNQLKKWLKHNNIQQPRHINKYECMELINKKYTYQSPTPTKIRYKLPPKTPKTSKKIDPGDDNIDDLLKKLNVFRGNDIEFLDYSESNDVYGTIRQLSFDGIEI
eukprot:425537_1